MKVKILKGWRLQYSVIFLLGVISQQLIDRFDGSPFLVVIWIIGIALVTRKSDHKSSGGYGQIYREPLPWKGENRK